jgi:GTP cyclohydrolase IA
MTSIEDPRRLELIAEPVDEGRAIDRGAAKRAAAELLSRARARSLDPGSLAVHASLLPFHGVAHVGYLPGRRIVGLSKLARVVELFAPDVQLRERLMMQIADWVQEQLEPKGVGVVLEAEHLCVSLRGVRKFGAKTVTSALQGPVSDDPRTRQEFLALTTRSD